MKAENQIALLESELAEWKVLALSLGDLLEDENARLRELGRVPVRLGRLCIFIERNER